MCVEYEFSEFVLDCSKEKLVEDVGIQGYFCMKRVARTYLYTDGDDLVEKKLNIQEKEGVTKNEGMGTRCNKNKERRQAWLQMQKERM